MALVSRKRVTAKDLEIVNLDRWIGKDSEARPRNRIYRVGVELEGAWDRHVVGLVHDGSVNPRDNPVFDASIMQTCNIGELPSPPLEPIEIPKWIKDNYPKYIKHTCGLHVHMSFFTPRHYDKLADSPSYQETMLHYLYLWGKDEGLKKDHPLWPRLEGKSEYCTKKFWPEMQIISAKDHDRRRKGNRYTAINYCWSVFGSKEGGVGTLECRVLPMMETPAQSARAVRRVIDVTNAYLVATASREELISGSVGVKGPAILWEKIAGEVELD